MVITMYEVNIYEQVAKNIKKYRQEAGLTQAELAEAIGVSLEFVRWDKLAEINLDEFKELK